MKRNLRQQRLFRLRVAYAITVIVLLVTFYGFTYVGMSPVSPGGLLILLGVGAFLWFFWRDTLAVIDYLRTRERLDRWEREEKQAQAKAQPEAGTEPEPGTEPAPAETSQREE